MEVEMFIPVIFKESGVAGIGRNEGISSFPVCCDAIIVVTGEKDAIWGYRSLASALSAEGKPNAVLIGTGYHAECSGDEVAAKVFRPARMYLVRREDDLVGEARNPTRLA